MEGFFGHLAIGKALDLVFPRFCLRCRAEGAAWCDVCAATFVPAPPRPRCAFCGTEGSTRTCDDCKPHTFLDGLTAVAPYGNAVVREALTAWKYHGDPMMGDAVALWIRQSLRAAPDRVAWDAHVTHVPLHAARRRHRGFDQAEEVARVLAEELRVTHRSLLARSVNTASQAQRAAADRRVGDLDGTFVPTTTIPERVLLCDDVCTSGATLDAAAQTLKAHGAKWVWAFVVAQGGEHG